MSGKFYTLLSLACASLAVLFVALGLYGLVSYSVSRRTAEFGIRMAVGASHATIARQVMGEGLRLAAAGIGLGLILAALLTRSMQTLLFGVEAIDPLTLGTAAAVVLLVTIAASHTPARPASIRWRRCASSNEGHGQRAPPGFAARAPSGVNSRGRHDCPRAAIAEIAEDARRTLRFWSGTPT